MEKLDYISWIDLKTDNIIALFTIAKLNSSYNTDSSLKETWGTIYFMLSKALHDLEGEFPFPQGLDAFFDDASFSSLEESWWDVSGKNNPYSYVQTKSRNLLIQENKAFAVRIYNKLCNEYGLLPVVVNVILSGAGPVLATQAVDWVIKCGDFLLEDYTPLEVYDILNVAANANKVGRFGRSRHLKIFEAFSLPEIPPLSPGAFKKVLSVVEPIAANLYEKQSFEQRNPHKTYIYQQFKRNRDINNFKSEDKHFRRSSNYNYTKQ